MSLFSGKKRAQAAVELLSTYGWAIMGVILVIGVLSYFDVFDAKRFISERCDTGNQVQCLEVYADDSGEFQLSLRNNYLVGIVLVDINVNGVPLRYYNNVSGVYEDIVSVTPVYMKSGNISRFGVDSGMKVIKGDKKTMDIVMNFRRDTGVIGADCSTGSCYNVSGTLVVKVQGKSVASRKN